jgi:hypothetical protein
VNLQGAAKRRAEALGGGEFEVDVETQDARVLAQVMFVGEAKRSRPAAAAGSSTTAAQHG